LRPLRQLFALPYQQPFAPPMLSQECRRQSFQNFGLGNGRGSVEAALLPVLRKAGNFRIGSEFNLREEKPMRKAANLNRIAAAGTSFMGAMLLAESCAQAVTLAAPIHLKAAIYEEMSAQEVACRRGRNCLSISSGNRQSNASEDTPYFQRR